MARRACIGRSAQMPFTRLTQQVSSRRRRAPRTERIRRALSSDRYTRLTLTQVIFEASHLALKRVDAFAEVAVARDT